MACLCRYCGIIISCGLFKRGSCLKALGRVDTEHRSLTFGTGGDALRWPGGFSMEEFPGPPSDQGFYMPLI